MGMNHDEMVDKEIAANRPSKKKLKKFLVISYDSDEQQWYWDFVMAADADQAKASILELRTYCQDADATPVDELNRVARNLSTRTPKWIEKQLQQLVKQHKGEQQYEYCDCGRRWQDCAIHDGASQHHDR